MSEEILKIKESDNEEEITPRDILRKALKEAWQHPLLQETRRNLKHVGEKIIKPAYEEAAKRNHIGEYYSELYHRRYKNIEEIDSRIEELKRKLAELEKP